MSIEKQLQDARELIVEATGGMFGFPVLGGYSRTPSFVDDEEETEDDAEGLDEDRSQTILDRVRTDFRFYDLETSLDFSKAVGEFWGDLLRYGYSVADIVKAAKRAGAKKPGRSKKKAIESLFMALRDERRNA